MPKTYHLPTSPANQMRVNVEQDRFAAAFICNAGPWTPAKSEELDDRMAVLFPAKDEDKDVCEPDEAVLAAMEAEEEPEDEPPPRSLFR